MRKISLAPKPIARRRAARDRVALGSWYLWLLAGTIAIGALLLRVWTIRQSLPYVDHPDEPNPIEYVIGMLRSGDPNQQFFQKPSLFVYLLLATIGIHYRAGLAAGSYSDLNQISVTTHIVTTLPGFFLVARWVSASFGALSVLSAYSLGARGWSRRAGLAGALFVAVLPYHLRFSQWATTDITAAFLVSMSLGAAIMIVRNGSWSAYLVAGAFAGLAASTKYNAGVVVGAIAVAMLARCVAQNGMAHPPTTALREPTGWVLLRQQLIKLGAAGLAAILCFVAGTPYALLRWSQVSGGIAQQWENYGGANGAYRGAWNVAGYADFFLFDGLNPLLCLAVLAGLIVLARRDWRVLAVWLGFALPSLLIHLSRPTHFMQNMLPLLVACALPVGVAVDAAGRLAARRGNLAHWATVAIVLAALVLPPLSTSLAYVGRQSAGDSRVQLLAWIDANIPPGARIAAEIKPLPEPGEQRWTDVPNLTVHDIAWYRAQGYAYLIASSKRWNQFEPPAAYGPLLANVVAEFGPHRREDMLGPRLLVVATGLSATDVPTRAPGVLRIGGARLLGVSVGDPAADGAPPMLVPTTVFRAGGVLGLRSFWQVDEPFRNDLYIFVHLLDANGGTPTQRDTPPWQGRFPTSEWQVGSLVVDANDLYLPPGLPPGEYRVVIGMFNPVDGSRPLVSLAGTPLPDGEYEIARITVMP